MCSFAFGDIKKIKNEICIRYEIWEALWGIRMRKHWDMIINENAVVWNSEELPRYWTPCAYFSGRALEETLGQGSGELLPSSELHCYRNMCNGIWIRFWATSYGLGGQIWKLIYNQEMIYEIWFVRVLASRSLHQNDMIWSIIGVDLHRIVS